MDRTDKNSKVTIEIETKASQNEKRTASVVVNHGTVVSVEALTKELSAFDPRVPLSFLLAAKKAARLKNAY